MSGRRAVLAAAVAVLLTAGQAGAQSSPVQPAKPDQPPRFKSSVDLVSVSAVVRDRKGRFVPDLRSHDFIVVEGGQKRPIVGFEAEEDGPVRLTLLLDVSGSMRVGSKAVDARQAARHLLSSLKKSDQASLFTFDTQLQRVSGFTSDFSKLDLSFDSVDPPFGQTSLYDAIAETAKTVGTEIAGKEGRLPHRTAIVVLTDGIDTKSRLTAEEVAAVASSIDIPVYIVAVMSPIDDPRNGDAGTGSMSSGLNDLSRWTGGDLFIAIAPAHTSIAARQIVGEMRHQYLLAFEASSGSGWRPLEIRARDREWVVRARSGYTAGGGRPSVDGGR